MPSATASESSEDDLNLIPSPHHSPAPQTIIPDSEVDRTRIQRLSEKLQLLVTEFSDGTIPTRTEFMLRARATGASAHEMADYIDQVGQVIAARRAARAASVPAEPTADPASVAARQAQDQQHKQAVEDAAWAALAANLEALDPEGDRPGPAAAAPNIGPLSAALLAKLLAPSSTSLSGIPSSILAAAPHLAQISSLSDLSEHLQETDRLRRLFKTDKDADAVADVLRSLSHPDPFAHSLWRLIVQDLYVDFEKLLASFGSHPSHHDDEPKDFGGGYALVRKDHISARRALITESDWTRCFDAWSRGVLLVYPHRSKELEKYRSIVVEMFRASEPDVSFAIRFDRQTRERYAKSPFELHDRSHLHFPMLAEMLRTRASPSALKRSAADSAHEPSPKRQRVLCQNWNLGKCPKTPCPGKRVHGTCCECGGKHPACDKEQCLILLTARRAAAYSKSGSGSAGTA